MSIGIGIVGLGDIALRRHIPAISHNEELRLIAAATPHGEAPARVPQVFTDYRSMLALPDVDAVAICTPPQVRYAIARHALEAGKHVLLEKPSTTTVAETLSLASLAESLELTLYTTWHSQQNEAVRQLRRYLANTKVTKLDISWHENFRAHHSGQQWIWEAGGFGVFDAGINPLSIATSILPDPLLVAGCELDVPADADTPAVANIAFRGPAGSTDIFRAHFSWLSSVDDRRFLLEASGHRFELRDSGGTLVVDSEVVVTEARREYEMIYDEFAQLLRDRQSKVDVRPLQVVSDAFLVARRRTIPEVSRL